MYQSPISEVVQESDVSDTAHNSAYVSNLQQFLGNKNIQKK